MPRNRSNLVVEILRVLVVIFGAAVGLQVAENITTSTQPVLGVLTAPMVGVIVGAGLGYSLGGVLSRRLVGALDRGEQALGGITPEELVSGAMGALLAAALVAIVTWPVFLITTPLIATSIFAFVVIVAGAFGFTVAQRRRSAVLAVASRAGVAVASGPGKGSLIDSSVAIDGRVLEVARAGFLPGPVYVAQPVLDELQGLADASDERRRTKGRRGLSTLDELRHRHGASVSVLDDEVPGVADVDAKLVAIARQRGLALLTNDSALAKVAAISGVPVQNLHALSIALRPPISVGDSTQVSLVREGKESGQAVGFLDDGTMIVVESATDAIGTTVPVDVTSVLTTSNGRMAFARRQESP